MYGVTETPVIGGAPPEPASAMRGSPSSSARTTASPASPSFWRSQVMRSDGVRFDRPLGCTTAVDTPGTADRRCGDVIERGRPALPLGVVVTLDPHLDSHQHPNRIFLADLERAREAMMRGAVDPRGAHEILAPEQQAAGLRTAQALAAAVADERRAVAQMHVGDRQDLGGGIDEHGNALGRRHRGNRLEIERTLVDAGPGHDVDERRARPERRLELGWRGHLDDAETNGANRGVVDVPRMCRDDGFILREARRDPAGARGDRDCHQRHRRQWRASGRRSSRW